MSLSVGDAILTFLADTLGFDAALDRLPGKVNESLAEAAHHVQDFQDQLDATGDNVEYAGDQIKTLSQAFRTLGVTGPDHLKQQWDASKAALQGLKDAGVDAKGTLLQATIKVTEKEIAYKAAVGENTTDLRKNLGALMSQFNDLGLGVEKGSKQARGALDLISERLGIAIPRELKNVIAHSQVAGEALSLAFKGAALLGMISLIAVVTDKVSKWIAETFIMNDALRASNEAIKNSNNALSGYADKIKESREEVERLGLAGAALANKSLDQLKTNLANAKAQFAELAKQMPQANADISKLQAGWQGWGKAASSAASNVVAYLKGVDSPEKLRITAAENIRSAYSKLGVEIKLMEDEVAKASVKAGTTETQERQQVFENRKSLEIAQTNLAYEQQRQQLANRDQLNSLGGALELSYQERLYQIELHYARQKLELLKADPTQDIPSIRAARAAIESIEKEHAAKLLKTATDLENAIMGLRLRQTAPGGNPADQFDEGADAATRLKNSLYPLGEAFKILGTESESDLQKKTSELSLAYEQLAESSKDAKVGQQELLDAEEKLLNAQIDLRRKTVKGFSDTDEAWMRFVHHVKTNSGSTSGAIKQVSDHGKQGLLAFASAVGTAVQAWALGQATIAQALKSAVQQTLASWAEQDAAAAVRELGYGFAALFMNPPEAAAHFQAAAILGAAAAAEGGAARAVGGAGTAPGTATNPVFTQQDAGPVGQPQQPSQRSNNIQRFATGALISQPTLAIVGDSRAGGGAREGVLPLDDPGAMDAIAGSIADRIGGGSAEIHHHWHVEGLVSPDNLSKVMRKMSRAVDRGQGRLTAGDSRRLTKRA